ncbi:MAG: hypothetical protein GYA51_06980, partial [Candidatus Methanofastidiosa archaeon]|nr:hypothetical protein [Candidatus Methanofastidiosa archaeon]
MKRIRVILLTIFVTRLISCTNVPDEYQVIENKPDVFPDIADIKIPDNIAPLNFRLNTPSEKVIAVFQGKNGNMAISGKDKIQIPSRNWHKFIRSNSNENMLITIFTKENGKWLKYLPINIEISDIPIDPYIIYRLIAPGYESWSEMGIYQRNLTNFDEDPIIDNRMLTGNCMNCHSFNKNDPGKMLFHLRGKIGATILTDETQV